jgi:prephenate dehydratase
MTERVAFPGPTGTFSEKAARHFGDPVPVDGFAAVVDAVLSGEADTGVLAIENAWVGAVPTTLDLLASSPLYVDGRVTVPVTLCLAGYEGATLDDIREVRSHPHALAQARGCVARLKALRASTVSTAAALDEVLWGKDVSVAALADPEAARARGMTILIGDAGDNANSRTRFVRVAMRPGRGRSCIAVCEGGHAVGRVIGSRPSVRGAFRTRVFLEGPEIDLTDAISGRVLGRYD